MPVALQVLDLSNNPLGDEGVIELAQPLPSQLNRLVLKSNYALLTP